MLGGSLKATLAKLAAGGVEVNPFPEAGLDHLRQELRSVLRRHGKDEGQARPGDAEQATDVRLVQALLEAFGDPDSYFAEWWAQGVWVGSPQRPLPRTPCLYDRKTTWNLKDDGCTLHGDWTANYPSLKEHEIQVTKQYRAEIEDGLMCSTTLGEAIDEFGDELTIAATGAIAKCAFRQRRISK